MTTEEEFTAEQQAWAAAGERRHAVDQLPERPADAVCEAVGDAVAEALATGAFDEHLRGKGWVLVHVGDGTCPEPPTTWLHEGLDLTEPGGLVDPIGHLAAMWREAWEAGNRVGRANGGVS
ncbi:hypothetical protein [Amycolatopsis thermophila]|uniref:Uncharacterized protein n=1 Tax=Amycolatopsis thermophila TaxID=206084 RepID=A0ABU0EMS8_9PSEU|nr:hypothetical protein [Amycolatopsis thermophila]MDQ0376595.1 hypothetical protein [Amycolatopsis thermophila]